MKHVVSSKLLFLMILMISTFVLGAGDGGGGGCIQAPSNVTATVASPTQVNVAWTAPSGATGITLQWSTNNFSTFTSVSLSGSANNYSHTSLAPNTTYYYRLTATASCGTSSRSSVVSATPCPLPSAAPNLVGANVDQSGIAHIPLLLGLVLHTRSQGPSVIPAGSLVSSAVVDIYWSRSNATLTMLTPVYSVPFVGSSPNFAPSVPDLFFRGITVNGDQTAALYANGYGNDSSLNFLSGGNLGSAKVGGVVIATYSYDSQNRLTSNTDAFGNATTWAYGSNGQLSTVNQAGTTTTFTYDTANRLTSISGRSGNIITIQYNSNGQPQTVSYLDTGITLSLTYDSSTPPRVATYQRAPTQSSPTTISYSSGAVSLLNAAGYVLNTRQYDSYGRTTSESQNTDSQNIISDSITFWIPTSLPFSLFQSNVSFAGSASPNPISYVRDPSGRPTSVTQQGATSTFAYNSFSNFTSVTLAGTISSPGETFSATYDSNGRPQSGTHNAYSWSLTYSSGGLLSSYSDTSGRSQSFNNYGQLTSQTNILSTGSTQYSYVPTGFAAGLLQSRTNPDSSVENYSYTQNSSGTTVTQTTVKNSCTRTVTSVYSANWSPLHAASFGPMWDAPASILVAGLLGLRMGLSEEIPNVTVTDPCPIGDVALANRVQTSTPSSLWQFQMSSAYFPHGVPR